MVGFVPTAATVRRADQPASRFPVPIGSVTLTPDPLFVVAKGALRYSQEAMDEEEAEVREVQKVQETEPAPEPVVQDPTTPVPQAATKPEIHIPQVPEGFGPTGPKKL